MCDTITSSTFLYLLFLFTADVIHTVGPIARGHLTDTHKENLASCYKSSLKLAKEYNIRSIVSIVGDHIIVFPSLDLTFLDVQSLGL